jgi:hypothetical protein
VFAANGNFTGLISLLNCLDPGRRILLTGNLHRGKQ